MRQLRAWFLRLGGLFGKKRREQELAEELDSHLQIHIQENLRSGMTPAEARRQALLKLGGVEQTKENYRDRRSLPVLETLPQGMRFAGCALRKNPRSIFRFWLFVFRFFVLRLFLFEEAAESVDGIGGILTLRQRLGGAGGGSAGASKLRLQHACGETPNIGNKFWIGSRAVNQERHGCRTTLTSTSAALDLTQDAADTACGTTAGCAARRASRRSRRVGEVCHHFEIEIVLCVDRAETGEITERGKDRQEIVRP